MLRLLYIGRLLLILGSAMHLVMLVVLAAIYASRENQGLAYFGVAISLAVVPIGSLLSTAGLVLAVLGLRVKRRRPSRLDILLGATAMALVGVWVGTATGVLRAPW